MVLRVLERSSQAMIAPFSRVFPSLRQSNVYQIAQKYFSQFSHLVVLKNSHRASSSLGKLLLGGVALKASKEPHESSDQSSKTQQFPSQQKPKEIYISPELLDRVYPYTAKSLPSAEELGISQRLWLEIYWIKLGEERGSPLTEEERAWNVPIKSFNFGQSWSDEEWQEYADGLD